MVVEAEELEREEEEEDKGIRPTAALVEDVQGDETSVFAESGEHGGGAEVELAEEDPTAAVLPFVALISVVGVESEQDEEVCDFDRAREPEQEGHGFGDAGGL